MNNKHQTLHNAVFNTLSRVFSMVVGFIFMPYVVHQLGVESYGIYVLIFAVIGYFALLDFDLGQAIVKYVAEYRVRNDYKRINEVVGVTLSLYLALGVLGSLVICVFADFITSRCLKIQEDLLPVARFALYIGSFGFILTLLLSAFSSIPKALNRYDITSKVTILVSLLTTLSTVSLLYMGFGLEAIVILDVLITLSTVLGYMLINRRILPELKYLPVFDLAPLKTVLSFGFYSSLGRISYIIQFQMDRILTGAILGASFVTYYFVPFTLVSKAVTLTSQLSGVILPVVSRLQGEKDFESVIGLYVQSSRLTIAIATSVCLPLFIFGNQFLSLWMGPEFSQQSGMVLMLITLGLYVDAFTNVPSFVVQGLGRPKITGIFAMATAIINLALFYPLAKIKGVDGIALAFLISTAVVVPIFIFYANNRVLGYSMIKLIKDAYILPFASLLLVGAPLFFFYKYPINNIFILLGIMMSASLIYLFVSALIGVFSKDELRQCLDYIGGIFRWLPPLDQKIGDAQIEKDSPSEEQLKS
jgi:O-antigen/teichoic acid export membrane protein